MSYAAQSARKQRTKQPRKNRNVKITPYPVMRLLRTGGSDFVGFTEALRTNNGAAIKTIEHLLKVENPNRLDHIATVTPVHNKDMSIIFLELRLATLTPNGHAAKEYKHIYIGDRTGNDDPAHDERGAFCSLSSALFEAGLFVPTNAPTALAAVDEFKKREEEYNKEVAVSRNYDTIPPAALMFLWFEGEKARLGGEALLEQEGIDEYLDSVNLEIVTLGILAGEPGARQTNLQLRPLFDNFLIRGVNDSILDLRSAYHVIVRDNDNAGLKEAGILARRLEDFRVNPENIRIAEPPPRAPIGWDDADPLPFGVTPLERITGIVNSRPYSEQWVFEEGTDKIDPSNRKNMKKAFKESVESFHYDISIGARILKLKNMSLNNSLYPEGPEIADIAERCCGIMGREPQLRYCRKDDWKDIIFGPLEGEPVRSIIYDECMERVKRGLVQMNEDNNPELLLIKSFNLPDNRTNRLKGHLIMRDMYALQTRPFINRQSTVPQCLIALVGPEGVGKSLFCHVLAGGKPGPTKTSNRYNDTVELSYLHGVGDHGLLALAQSAACRTVIEFADKVLGSTVGKGLAGDLKHLANMGEINFKRKYGVREEKAYFHAIRIFTTNNPEILNLDMGNRRWIIIDITTALSTPITNGKNLGLNWLYNNLDAMYAHIHNSKEDSDPEAPLNVPEELINTMWIQNENYREVTDSKILMEEVIHREPYINSGPINLSHRGMMASSIVIWMREQKTSFRGRDIGQLMANLGYNSGKSSYRGNQYRVWSTGEPKDVKEYVHYHPSPVMGGKGRWIISNNPLDDEEPLPEIRQDGE
jgi:hypothetical protein